MTRPFVVIAGWILCIVAIICRENWKRQRKRLTDIASTPTSKVAELLQAQKNSGKIVEVKGKLVAEEILSAPFTQRDCVFFHSTERDKVRAISYDSRSGSGRKRERIYYSTNTDSRSSQKFFIEDETGKIGIDPEGFEIEGDVVLKTEKATHDEKNTINLGVAFQQCGEKIIAVLRKEMILPPGKRAYAIGELFVGSQGPFIGADPLKEKTCLVSLQSEESMLSDSSESVRKNLVIGILSLIAGLSLIV